MGLLMAGFKFDWVGFSEIDKFAIKVYEKNFPYAENLGDITKIDGYEIKEKYGQIDLVTGGFPCQDISKAGTGQGISGSKSALWKEMFRLICEIRPRHVIVENVSALLGRGINIVLGNLASCGYDAEWDCLPASAFGAPHQRDRVWIVAYTKSERRKELLCCIKKPSIETIWASRPLGTQSDTLSWIEKSLGQPCCIGVNDGLSYRVDKLGCLGNAVVPQVVEWIGKRLLRL